jgi:HlyD family secretion protein
MHTRCQTGFRVARQPRPCIRWQLARLLLLAALMGACASRATEGRITASGFIEGEQAVVAAEISGRVTEVLTARGEAVKAGQVLVRLDDALLQTQRQEALAALAGAEANLARVQAGARPEEIAAARARLAQAEAERDGAAQAVVWAREAISNPLSLDMAIHAARTQVEMGEQEVELARAQLAEADLLHNVYTGKGASADTCRTWELQLKAAQAALARAQAELQGERDYLNVLLAQRARPLELEAQLHQAEAQQRVSGAAVVAARAALELLEAGPTAEEIAIAEAQVRIAQAAVRLAEAQMTRLTLRAPLDGIVTTCAVHAGEMAAAGAPLITIANLDELRLLVYIPEDRIGHVRLGQPVEVRVDAFPGRAFEGRISYIAGEAEFTPRSVQTKEERTNLVFAVKITIPNPDHALKPGMPADATLIAD